MGPGSFCPCGGNPKFQQSATSAENVLPKLAYLPITAERVSCLHLQPGRVWLQDCHRMAMALATLVFQRRCDRLQGRL